MTDQPPELAEALRLYKAGRLCHHTRGDGGAREHIEKVDRETDERVTELLRVTKGLQSAERVASCAPLENMVYLDGRLQSQLVSIVYLRWLSQCRPYTLPD